MPIADPRGDAVVRGFEPCSASTQVLVPVRWPHRSISTHLAGLHIMMRQGEWFLNPEGFSMFRWIGVVL